MDARTTAAARAVALLVRDANCAAIADNARLRQALRHARQAVLQCDRAMALHRLANELPRAPPLRLVRQQSARGVAGRARRPVARPAAGAAPAVPRVLPHAAVSLAQSEQAP